MQGPQTTGGRRCPECGGDARRRRAKTVSLLLALAVASGCATTRGTRGDVLTVLSTVASGAERADTVWPGYRPFERGFIVFDPDDAAWLVAPVPPPLPWTPVGSEHPRLSGRLYRRPGALPGLTGGVSTAYRVGERAYPAVEHSGTVRSTIVTLFHEAFHTYQDSAFADWHVTEFLPAEATAAPQIAAIELERRILLAALRAPRGPPADSLVAAFLAVRSERMGTLPDSARRADRMLERTEGTAHLVGYQTAAAAMELDPERVTAAVAASLQEDLSGRGGDPGSRYYRWRAYGTGAAIGLLLDGLASHWREGVAAGAPLDSMLAHAAPIPPSPALLADARRRFGYDGLLAAAQRISSPPEDPIQEFLALEPHRLVIEIRADTAFRPSMSFTPGPSGIVTPAPSLLLLQDATRASMVDPNFEISIEDRPIMIDGRNAPTYRLVVMLPQPARIDGAEAVDLRRPAENDAYRITGRGTSVVVRGTGLEEVVVEPGVITVRVRAR